MRKLLLADASAAIQRVVELTFAGEDMHVVSVSDGEQAIARIPAEKPDIVLADIAMPKRTGYEVAAFVKQHPELSRTPVLLLAGAFEPVDEARAKQVQSDGVLVKPFEPQQVIARVRELVEARGGERPSASATPVTAPVALPALEAEHHRTAEVAVPRQEVPSKPPPKAGGSLDDYFDRLDAAFATLGNGRAERPSTARSDREDEIFRSFVTEREHAHAPVPTIDDLLAGSSLGTVADGPSPRGHIAPPTAEPPDAPATLAASPAARSAPERGEVNVIAAAFNRLLAIEQGHAAPLAPHGHAQPSSVVVTDDLVEQVTRRVLERLAPAIARQLVAEIVSDIAERLVREEIQRIRNPKTQSPNPKTQSPNPKSQGGGNG